MDSSSIVRSSRHSTAFAVAIALAVVLGSSLALGASPTAAASSNPTVSAASGPLAQVSGPSYPTQTPGAASQYGYTVTPDPSVSTANQPMTVLVSLGSEAGLSAFVDQVQNPASPMYHAFASPSAIAGAFGADPGAYASDAAYFAGYGLTATPDPTRMVLSVTGTIPEIEAAFHTRIGAFQESYRSPGLWSPLFGNASADLNSTTSRTIFLSTGNAYLPSGMHAAGIAGLGTLFAQPQLSTAFVGLSPATGLAALGHTTSIPSGTTAISAASALGKKGTAACASQNYTWGQLLGIDWQFLFPCSMPALTGGVNLWNGVNTIRGASDRGQGVTIGILDVGCPIPSDLQTFKNLTGVDLPSHLTVVSLNTPFEFNPNTNLTGCINNGFDYGWTIETTLDLEYAAAMAPQAHIVLISIGDASLTSFDSALLFTSQYLTTGGATALPAGVASVLNLFTGATSQTTSAADSSVSITSNSYGTGEFLTAIFGTPQYLGLENEVLDILAAEGVTNLFASGDSGPSVYPFPVQAAIPADASGVTSVGGGMVTAEYNGQEFPNTGVSVTISGEPMIVVPVSGVASYTYWLEALYIIFGYPSGNVTVPALPPGWVGGGLGQSSSLPQPWWQNALDVYDSGARIDPVISGSAAFNMSVYAFGAWQLTYGGTSFATPIFAGEWALIEEQALAAFGTPKFGEINALLFEAHNAQQAGATGTNPYLPMTDIGTGGITFLSCPASACGINIYQVTGLWGPSNPYATYLVASQDEFPQDQNLPSWFGTLNNPAGSGWNYLQGLGMPFIDKLDGVLIGPMPSAHRVLDSPPFTVEQVAGGALVPIQALLAGTTYTLEVVGLSGPLSGTFSVTAYSGGVTTTTTVSGPFPYTPLFTPQQPFTNGSEYGYFRVVAMGSKSPPSSFQDFAVAQPMLADGTLTLGVMTPLGLVTAGEAQVPMEQATGLGPVITGGQALVTLDGVPVGGAVITQTALDVPPAAIADPTIPVAAPGQTLGTYLTTASGLAAFWTDSGQLFVDVLAQAPGTVGPILPVVFSLQASYDGLVSNAVTVVAEPQSGYFSTNLGMENGQITGTVGFYGMTYLDFLNVSVGSAPGEFENFTFPAGTTYTGQIAVDLTAPENGPAVVSVMAAGESTFMTINCGGLVGYGSYFMLCGLNSPFTYASVWEDPVVLLPATLSSSTARGTVEGVDTVTWTGAAMPGASGTLSLVWAGGSEVLAHGVSGSYALDTTRLLDGAYQLVYAETAPGAVPTTQTLNLYADNQVAGLSKLVGQLNTELSADQATIASLNAQAASLESSIASDQASLASLQAQVASLSGQTSALQSELAAAQATASSLRSQLSALQASSPADSTLVVSLQGQVSAADLTISSTSAQLDALTTKLQTLQSELNARTPALPLWGLLVIVALSAAVIGLVTVVFAQRRRSLPSPKRRDAR